MGLGAPKAWDCRYLSCPGRGLVVLHCGFDHHFIYQLGFDSFRAIWLSPCSCVLTHALSPSFRTHKHAIEQSTVLQLSFGRQDRESQNRQKSCVSLTSRYQNSKHRFGTRFPHIKIERMKQCHDRFSMVGLKKV